MEMAAGQRAKLALDIPHLCKEREAAPTNGETLATCRSLVVLTGREKLSFLIKDRLIISLIRAERTLGIKLVSKASIS